MFNTPLSVRQAGLEEGDALSVSVTMFGKKRRFLSRAAQHAKPDTLVLKDAMRDFVRALRAEDTVAQRTARGEAWTRARLMSECPLTT